MLDLDEVLREAVAAEASDIHVKVGSPPIVRVDGRLVRTERPAVTAAETERVAFAIMPKGRAEEFLAHCEADDHRFSRVRRSGRRPTTAGPRPRAHATAPRRPVGRA